MLRLMWRTCAALALAAVLLPNDAQAQKFPDRAVRVICGFAAGGTTDIFARLIASKLSEMWGVPVFVDSKPGGNGNLAAGVTAGAEASGHTILMTTNAHTITPAMGPLPYDPVADFVPLTLVAFEPHVLVVAPGLPINSVADLVAMAKSKPGAMSYSSSGAGTAPGLAMEMFKQVAGVDILHVPYRGGAPAAQALSMGEVQAMMGAISVTASTVSGGKAKILAVTSPKRDPSIPDVPTIAESGYPGFDTRTWFGMVAPGKVPPEIVARLNADIIKALMSPDVHDRIAATGVTVAHNSSEDFHKQIVAEIAAWKKVVEKLQ